MTILPPSPFLSNSVAQLLTTDIEPAGAPPPQLAPAADLCESPASVETLSSVSTAGQAASLSTSPHPHDEAAETIPDPGIGDIHEIFHHGRRLVQEGRRREQIERGCLAAVARAVEGWQAEYEASHGWAWYAMNDLDPPPLFLRGRA